MSSISRVISNYKLGSGDWIIFYKDGEILYEGHSVPNLPSELIPLMMEFTDSDMILSHEMTDEQILDWENNLDIAVGEEVCYNSTHD